MDIIKATLSDFDMFFSEIEKNFIPDERRDYEDALRLFKEGKYEIIQFLTDGEKVGFITVWTISDFVFAEHFVIFEKYRNRGLGARALNKLKDTFSKIVLEAETPETDIAKRRLAFYERCGFIRNEQEYFQPAYRDNGSEVPLVIMSYPSALDNFGVATELIRQSVYFKNRQ